MSGFVGFPAPLLGFGDSWDRQLELLQHDEPPCRLVAAAGLSDQPDGAGILVCA